MGSLISQNARQPYTEPNSNPRFQCLGGLRLHGYRGRHAYIKRQVVLGWWLQKCGGILRTA
jgi:hypothetical protein